MADNVTPLHAALALIVNASRFFASEEVAFIRRHHFLPNDGSLDDHIGEALEAWLKGRVPADVPSEDAEAHAGRIALEILGAGDAGKLDRHAAALVFRMLVRSAQPELCKAITGGIACTPEKPGDAPPSASKSFADRFGQELAREARAERQRLAERIKGPDSYIRGLRGINKILKDLASLAEYDFPDQTSQGQANCHPAVEGSSR